MYKALYVLRKMIEMNTISRIVRSEVVAIDRIIRMFKTVMAKP